MKLQTLNLSSEPILDYPDPEPESDLVPVQTQGFWKRQFQQIPTRKQTVFDWVYGVVLPLVCVAADPIVFKSQGPHALLGTYRPFAYLLSAVSILAMVAWLLWRERLGWLTSVVAGIFLFGGTVSLLVGLLLLPFSLVGIIFFLFGLLGFTPLFSAVVYLRNGMRAYRASVSILGDQLAWQATLLAMVFSCVIPYVVNWEIYRLVNGVLRSEVNAISNASKLRYVAPLVDFGPISVRYHRTSVMDTNTRREELKDVYEDVTGEAIEDGPRSWD